VVAEAVATEPTAPQTTPGPEPAPWAAAPAAPVATPVSGGTVAFKFDAKRWSQADRIAGGATLVLLISLFLAWFKVSYLFISASASGLSAHGFLYLVLIICLVVLAYLVLRAGYEQLPFKLPLAHEPLLLIATLVNLVLVLIAFLDKPSVLLASAGWDFGAFVALVVAVVAAAPLGIPAIKARTNSAK
jgi:membrane-associated HD superfamily phosphohydrolase